MKKAKEYAADFNTNPTDEALFKIAQAFLLEIQELTKVRRSTSNETIISILDEQDRKWRAFARLADSVREDGFENLIRDQMSGAYWFWRGSGRNMVMRFRPRGQWR